MVGDAHIRQAVLQTLHARQMKNTVSHHSFISPFNVVYFQRLIIMRSIGICAHKRFKRKRRHHRAAAEKRIGLGRGPGG